MTTITEHRLKCDYCGAMSPVFTDTHPRGWTEQGGRLQVNKGGNHIVLTVEATEHFCIPAHREAWLAKQEKVKDEP